MGRNKVHDTFVSYEKCKKFARKMNVKTYRDWTILKKPKSYPMNPQSVYKKEGWIDWEHFHGNPTSRVNFLSYEQAKKLVKKLGIKSSWEYKMMKLKKELRKYHLPTNLDRHYKKEWEGSGKFFGTWRGKNWQSKSEFKSFKQAKQWAKDNKITSGILWKHMKLPRDIPRNPHIFYKEQWKNWNEFLDFNRKLTYEEAKNIVKKLGIKTTKQYKEMPKKQKLLLKLPSHPDDFYR